MTDYLVRFTDHFRPDAAGLSKPNAYLLALAAKLAYAGAPEARAITTLWGFDKNWFHPFDVRDTQGFMTENDATLLIAFRGTTSIRDWITDARILQLDGPTGKVHKGFLDAWRDVEAAVRGKIAGTGPRRIWICGHSLGGALAKVAAASLHFGNPPVAVQGVVTFGQPRVGNARFAAAFDAAFGGRSFRFINDRDIVPRVPPGLEYTHDGGRLFINSQGEITPEAQSDGPLERLHAAALALPGKGENIADHSMDEYVRLIRQAWAADLSPLL